MLISLDDCRKVKGSRAAAQERWEDEEMCVNYGPVMQVAASFGYQHPHELSPPLPDDLASIDLDAFVGRVYALASQA